MGSSFLLSTVRRWDGEREQIVMGRRDEMGMEREECWYKLWLVGALLPRVGRGGGSVGVVRLRVQKCEEYLELGMDSFCGSHFGVKEKAVGGVLKSCASVTSL